MWQEARKQEKKIRGMMVDHKKRAERRREYYEKIKQDPAQFLQAYGRPCKIHIDATIAAAADSPANMMPWQGQKDNMIDRFDGRAHLDIISENTSSINDSNLSSSERTAEKREQRELNYERYRILVQNDFLKIPEERFLRTIELEEQFGGKTYQAIKSKEEKRKVKKDGKGGAAIGFNYDEENANLCPVQEIMNCPSFSKGIDMMNLGSKSEIDSIENSEICLGQEGGNKPDVDSEDEDSDLDLDLTVDIMALNPEQRVEINSKGKSYGLGKEDFIKNLARDIEEAADLKHAKEKEEEKAMFSGRKSRRERRIIREKQLAGRKLSPPSYAVSVADDLSSKKLSKHTIDSASSDSDSSKASSNSGHAKYKRRKLGSRAKNQSNKRRNKVEFITTFGGSGADSEEIEERENEKEKIQAAKREDARMRLKTLRRNDSPPLIIGPLLPPEVSSRSRDLDKNGGSSNNSTSNIHKRRGGNYRDCNKRRSRSKSPSIDYKHRRPKDSHNRDNRDRSRSKSRGRRSRSPRDSRGNNSSRRRRSTSRQQSRSPRRKMSSRRSRSRSRRSNSRSHNRETIKSRGDLGKLRMPSRNSKSPQKSTSTKRPGNEKDSKPASISENILSNVNADKPEEKKKCISSSDSSSSEENGTALYRSKYRDKRRSSSSSEDENDAVSKQKSHDTSDNVNGKSSSDISANNCRATKNNNLEESTNSPLAKAKKMLAITTAKEKEEGIEYSADLFKVEQTKTESTKNSTSNKDLDEIKKDRFSHNDPTQYKKSERITAPPPPSIRVKSPEPPPMKRYYKRALKRAGGSSSDELFSDEDPDNSKHEKGSGLHSYGGSKLCPEEHSSANMHTTSSHYASTTTSLGHVSGNNTKASSNSMVLDAKDKAAVKDKIKKRVQAAIKRQFKADQKAEEARKQRAEDERLYREEEMRDIALKLRKREREKTGLATTTGDPIPPLMGEPEVRGWDENQDYRMDTYSSRYKSNERFGRSPPPRSRSRSPRLNSRRYRSRSPDDSKYYSLHDGQRDRSKDRDPKKTNRRIRRSRSKSPDDSRKSNKQKFKLVDY